MLQDTITVGLSRSRKTWVARITGINTVTGRLEREFVDLSRPQWAASGKTGIAQCALTRDESDAADYGLYEVESWETYNKAERFFVQVFKKDSKVHRINTESAMKIAEKMTIRYE